MSWDADLFQEFGPALGEWNYTHNCNGMANAVLYDDYEQQSVFEEVFTPTHVTWWDRLNGMDGIESSKFLETIIRGLERDPERFRAMNPGNGWGNYDSFLATLKEMKAAIPEARVRWETSG